ncbi:hypothetical protein DM860_018059 [Cuscuta australis]|uniref:Uncharacterized protein n=1 Tax=Cuscuta australis TaxID=267555 RepID=A0A328D9Z1_9ASTE|nr:hypothetical protein DM860_018059 [Cuscuta australis]
MEKALSELAMDGTDGEGSRRILCSRTTQTRWRLSSDREGRCREASRRQQLVSGERPPSLAENFRSDTGVVVVISTSDEGSSGEKGGSGLHLFRQNSGESSEIPLLRQKYKQRRLDGRSATASRQRLRRYLPCPNDESPANVEAAVRQTNRDVLIRAATRLASGSRRGYFSDGI